MGVRIIIRQKIRRFYLGATVFFCVAVAEYGIYAEELPQEAENVLMLEDGCIAENEELQEALDIYFERKSEDLKKASDIGNVLTLSESSGGRYAFSHIRQAEQTKFAQIEMGLRVDFKEVHCMPYVVYASENDDTVTVLLYEWIGIDYGAYEDSEPQDYMGYGIAHILTLGKENETYIVLDDCYQDEMMTGIISEYYEKEQFECFEIYQQEVDIFRDNLVNEEKAVEIEQENSILASTTSYKPYLAVKYAHRYCGITDSEQIDEGVDRNGYITDYYNQNFTVYPDRDCANFVSQCLGAGGLQRTTTWKPDEYAWVNAKGLANYLISLGYSSVRATSAANTFPGNPVYWLNAAGSPSGHQMICTGKNFAGTPVVDAHNSDIYRISITKYSQNHTLYTIQIVKSYTHFMETSIKYDSQYHWQICLFCKAAENKKTHVASSSYTYDAAYHWKKCASCPYQMQKSQHVKSSGYSYDATSHWRNCTSGCGKKYDNVGHNYILSGSTKTCRVCGYTTSNTYSVEEEIE